MFCRDAGDFGVSLMRIGRWSEASFGRVDQEVERKSVGEQVVMSGEVGL